MAKEPSIRSELIIVVLALVSVALIVVDVTMELSPADTRFLDRVDLVIALIFLSEWTWRFIRAESRMSFVRRSWWELLASIPLTHEMAQSLRSLRLLRLVRLVRLLRLVRLGVRLHILFSRSRQLAGETHLISLATWSGLLMLGGTVGFHVFENGSNPAVHSLFDSFWWTVCTVTTVGYGDIAPTTTGGRFVGLLLMIFGAGVIATFTALVASYLVRHHDEDDEAFKDGAAG